MGRERNKTSRYVVHTESTKHMASRVDQQPTEEIDNGHSPMLA